MPAARPLPEIMAERMSLVARVTDENARQLRLRQVLGGIEMELMREGDAADAALRRRDGDTRAAMVACDAAREALEAELAALDRELAAS